MTKRIENDEQYQKSLDWLITASIELEDPLLDGPERAKKQAIYDRVDQLVQAYKRGRLIEKFPGLREQYDKLGWEYDLQAGPAEPKQPAQPSVPQQAVQEAQEERAKMLTKYAAEQAVKNVYGRQPTPEPEQKQFNLASWLDGDDD